MEAGEGIFPLLGAMRRFRYADSGEVGRLVPVPGGLKLSENHVNTGGLNGRYFSGRISSRKPPRFACEGSKWDGMKGRSNLGGNTSTGAQRGLILDSELKPYPGFQGSGFQIVRILLYVLILSAC